jgi:ankyrin repeat protein
MIIALIYGKAKIVKLLQSLGINLIGEACDAHFAHDPGELFFTTSLGLLSAQPILNESLECFLADYACAITPHAFVHMMHSAAGNGNIDALQLLLNVNRPMQDLLLMQHPDIRIYRVEYGQWFPYLTTSGTVLHTAVLAGRIEIVKLLLQHQSDPDVLDAHGRPASHIAAWIGRADILELLLSHGCEVDARDSYLQTTLGSAVGFGHVEVVRVLLDRHADLTASKDRGVCLIQTAISCGNPAVFFLLADAGLEPTSEDICSWYKAGNWQVLMSGNHMERLAVMPEFLQTPDTGPEMKAVLNITPPHYRKLNLTCRVMIMNVRNSVFYRASTLDDLEAVILLHNAGAMLNLDGGAEGTPLMGACKAGRLGVVKYLVRHGAILNYEKHGVPVSAFDKAASYPKIQRWLLIERFTEQRMILGGETHGEQAADMEEGDTWTDEIAEVTLDLVLEDDVEQYLESKNWFLPMRRFVDDGQGAFVRVPILQAEFARYRPLDFKVSPK